MSLWRTTAFYLLVANWIIAALLFLSLTGMWLAMAAMAPEIDSWPLAVFVPLGLALTVWCVLAGRTVGLSRRRVIGLATIPPVLLYALVLWGLGWQEFSAVREAYIIPAGYHGNIYVLHDVHGGRSASSGWHKRTYVIGDDGVAVVSDGIAGLSQEKYYDRMPDGSLRRIKNEWLTTIPETPENLSNTRDRGVYFPRTGRGATQNCSVSFEQIYVGSMAQILADKSPDYIEALIARHPEACAK